MTTPEELGSELAAWERLVEAHQKTNPFIQSDSHELNKAQDAYQIEALAFRMASIDRVVLTRYLLRTVHWKHVRLTLISELNKDELRELTPELIRFALSKNPNPAYQMYAVVKECLRHINPDEIRQNLIHEFSLYIIQVKSNQHIQILETISESIENLLYIGMERYRNKLLDIVLDKMNSEEFMKILSFVEEFYGEVKGDMNKSTRHT